MSQDQESLEPTEILLYQTEDGKPVWRYAYKMRLSG